MPSPDPAPRAPAVVLGPPFHPCRLGPVVRQVGEYLAGADAPQAEQRHAAAHAFRNAQSDFEQFTASVREGHAMISMELRINGGGRELLSVSTYLPSPLTLLLVCTRNCEDGDLVGVRQVTAKCGSMTQEAHWPFGLAEAERLTRPVSVVFAELQEAGPESVRRRERTIVRRRVVTERRREQTRLRVPRFRRWREARVKGIEVCVGVRSYRVGRVSDPSS
jgi:hypothetical protein